MLRNSNSGSWFLEGKLANSKSWIIPIEKLPFVIGRNMDCNLTLASTNVSRKQAQIFLKGSALLICDLKSTNGTFVNHKKISKDTTLENGDTLNFGEFEFQIYFKSPMKESFFDKTNLLKNPLKNDDFIDYFKITKKEKEVLFLLLQGKSTALIAKMISVSAGTAKNHILSIYKKTDTHSKFELLTLYNNFKKDKK